MSITVDIPTPEPESPDVVVINSDTPEGLSADATLALGEQIGEIIARLDKVEGVAFAAKDTAEVAIMVAEVASETAAEAEAEVEEIPEEIPDLEPEPEAEEEKPSIKPKREHWLWRNPKKFGRK